MLKTSISKLVFVFLLASGNFLLAINEHEQSVELNIARNFIENLKRHNYEEAWEMCDKIVQSKISEEQIEQIWEGILDQYGDFSRIKTTTINPYQGMTKTDNLLQFRRGNLNARITIDTSHKIAGFFFSLASASEFKEPDYTNRNDFDEIDIKFGLEEWELQGKLCIPSGKGPFPAVVLVHGSGPHDMDETVGSNKPFRDIAWGLATRGVVVLRYDKRTYEYNDEFAEGDIETTLYNETIQDAVEAAKFLSKQNKVNKNSIFILGHSLGAMSLPLIAELDKISKGYIGLATSARTLDKLIESQYTYILNLDGILTEDEKNELDDMNKKLEYLRGSEFNKNSPADSLPLNIPANYWTEMLEYDIPGSFKRMSRPVLILQGMRDYQVTTEDYHILKESLSGKNNFEFNMFEKLNHLFIPGYGISKPEEYNEASNVDLEVIIYIANWIKTIK